MSNKYYPKEVTIGILKNRISLLEGRGEYNRKLVNSLKRELRLLMS